jgi:hypothetical protein
LSAESFYFFWVGRAAEAFGQFKELLLLSLLRPVVVNIVLSTCALFCTMTSVFVLSAMRPAARGIAITGGMTLGNRRSSESVPGGTQYLFATSWPC